MSRGYAAAYSLYDYKGKLTDMSINLDDYFRIGVLSSPHFHGQRIGIIEDYMENEADQTIFICKCDDGSTKYILDLPYFVEGVDLEAGIVHVNILEGM